MKKPYSTYLNDPEGDLNLPGIAGTLREARGRGTEREGGLGDWGTWGSKRRKQ